MSFKSHITDVFRSSVYHLRNISKIRKYLTCEATEMVVHAFVTSKFCDYGNPVLYGLPKFFIAKLQPIQILLIRLWRLIRLPQPYLNYTGVPLDRVL